MVELGNKFLGKGHSIFESRFQTTLSYLSRRVAYAGSNFSTDICLHGSVCRFRNSRRYFLERNWSSTPFCAKINFDTAKINCLSVELETISAKTSWNSEVCPFNKVSSRNFNTALWESKLLYKNYKKNDHYRTSFNANLPPPEYLHALNVVLKCPKVVSFALHVYGQTRVVALPILESGISHFVPFDSTSKTWVDKDAHTYFWFIPYQSVDRGR